ncbi:alcohol dehydrogenase zinc-binding domain-containing protein [Entophlyctis helioformis]|nr:alcohol dehydrogenase zinc-binding domain-containing protein [Entophlyctis helioformis]
MSNDIRTVPGLPQTYRKYVVHTLANDFTKATRLETHPVKELLAKLGPKMVIVRNTHYGINASDINFTAGRYDPTVKPPFDCGFEAIGEVVATGPGCKVALRQPVALMLYGAFSEYQIVPERLLLKIPSIDKRFLAILVSGLTASLALEYHGHMKSGEVVMVTAAAGGAGQIAVQLAKLAGNHVIGTCSSDSKAKYLKSIGCDRVINYRTENIGEVLKKEYPKGVDIVFESVGGDTFKQCMKALAVKGRMIVIGAVSVYSKQSDPNQKINSFEAVWTDIVPTVSLLGKSTTVTGFFLNHYFSQMPEHMDRMSRMILDGKLHATVHPENYAGLDDIPRAIEDMHKGANTGKLVVTGNAPAPASARL